MRNRKRWKSAIALEGLESRNYLSSFGGIVTNVAQGMTIPRPASIVALNPQPLPPMGSHATAMSLRLVADELNPQPLPP